jgi:hypothetical protein
MLGNFPAYGDSYYPSWADPAFTDASGDVDLWLFPSGPYNTYTLTAVPPADTGLATFHVYDVVVVSDMTVIIVLQFSEPPPPRACPLSQGFWKNQAEFWPVAELTLGSQSYTQAELIQILQNPIVKDASLILAHQLIAAKLNIAWGTDPAPIADAVSNADTLLSADSGKLPYSVKPSSPKGKAMVALAETLDDYNNEILTPNCERAPPRSPDGRLPWHRTACPPREYPPRTTGPEEGRSLPPGRNRESARARRPLRQRW